MLLPFFVLIVTQMRCGLAQLLAPNNWSPQISDLIQPRNDFITLPNIQYPDYLQRLYPKPTAIITDCTPSVCQSLSNLLQLMIVSNLIQGPISPVVHTGLPLLKNIPSLLEQVPLSPHIHLPSPQIPTAPIILPNPYIPREEPSFTYIPPAPIPAPVIANPSYTYEDISYIAKQGPPSPNYLSPYTNILPPNVIISPNKPAKFIANGHPPNAPLNPGYFTFFK